VKPIYPYFGSKRRVADVIWSRLGDCTRYVEPFLGSAAVLLSRPADPSRVEICNDADAMISNLWRAIQAAPEAVVRHAEWPKHECDLHARHRWLVAGKAHLRDLLIRDPDAYDPRAAGWWLAGISIWLGSGWCEDDRDPERFQVPHPTPQGYNTLPDPAATMAALQMRTRRVTFLCGDWTRAVTPAMLGAHVANGVTGVVLDPTYDAGKGAFYGGGNDGATWHDAQRWAIEHGDDQFLRIALCGYDGIGEAMPDNWEAHHWSAAGAYQTTESTDGRANGKREVIWFSPHCNRQMSLFGETQASSVSA
jgi:DNA adenine methylase